MSLDDPLAMCNIPGGLRYLRWWHSQKNANHPLRVKERADTAKWLAALQATQTAAVTASVKSTPKRRIKKETPRMDADGKYRL